MHAGRQEGELRTSCELRYAASSSSRRSSTVPLPSCTSSCEPRRGVLLWVSGGQLRHARDEEGGVQKLVGVAWSAHLWGGGRKRFWVELSFLGCAAWRGRTCARSSSFLSTLPNSRFSTNRSRRFSTQPEAPAGANMLVGGGALRLGDLSNPALVAGKRRGSHCEGRRVSRCPSALRGRRLDQSARRAGPTCY